MALRDDLKAAQEALADPNTKTYVYQGLTYSLTQLRDVLIPRLEKRIRDEEAKTSRAKNKIDKARSLLDDANATLIRNRNAFAKGNITEAELTKTEQLVAKRQAELDALLPKTEPAEEPAPTTARPGVPADAAAEEAMRTEAFAGRVPTTTPRRDVTGAAAPKKVTRANVTAELAKRGLPDTPENRAMVRAELEGTKAKASWEELVAEQAGEYAYLLDPKYEGVPELLRKGVEQGWFKSKEGLAQFEQELKKTPYGQNTTKNQQVFDLKTPGEKQLAVQKQIDAIRAEYGEIQFDQTALEEVAGVAARNGSTGIDLGRLVYRAAFKRGAAAPTFTAPTAAKTALGGADADRIRAIYRAYGQRPDDDQIARILAQETDPASGVVMTEDMLRNNLRDLAKVSYKPFADLLDRGVSVQTIFSPYQQIAASVLEQAPDQVALIDDRGVPTKFATALMGKEPMSLTEWITTLKSDNKYGWQFTNEAKQQATNLVMDLEKAFGYRA
jgi:hypothetical protein